jgi:PAS domain S-box-containing protein
MMPDIRKTILLVVNDAEYALHETEQFKTRGFNVVTANSGETAVGIVENGPKIDLVIMGLDLGCGIDGIQAAEMILQSHDIPLLFLAGHLEPETIDKTEKLSHYGLILKSGGDAVLLSSINMAFRLHNTHVEIKIREQLLRESQEKFSKSFHLTPLSMAISLASDRRYIEINDAFLSLTGYSREEVIGRNSLELGLWTDAETKTHVNHEIATAGEAHNVPVRVRTKSGEIRDAIYSAAIVFLGGVPHVVAQVLDITERKRVEQALRESEEKYRKLIETMQDGVYRSSQEGKFFEVNPAMVKMLGYDSKEELLAIDIKSQLYCAPEDREIAHLEEKLEKLSVFRHRKKDGSEIWVEDHGRQVVDDEGTVLYNEGVLRDITERKRAEQALRESEEKYRKLIETMLDGVYRSSHEGKFLEVNPAMVKILGYANKEELLAIDIKSQLYFAPEDRERAEKLGEMGAFRLRKKDGSEIWVEDHGLVVVDDEGTVLYHEGILRDITERKQLEERIRQVRSDLLFAVSHDLKTPLMVLNQSKEMLNELAPGEGLARFQEYQQVWRRNLQRLERMINNLVDSQRGEEDRFPLLLAPCRLEEIVQRVVEDLTGYALALQVQFDLQLEPVPEGSCDEETITRVVENLLTNAVKFSPKGGRVEIRLGMEGNTLRLEVEDRGCGIPANEQAQLFQPFQRNCSAQQKGIPGTGLGLYVCRRIMEAHGGSISLQSTEGVGTIVTVTLPLRE